MEGLSVSKSNPASPSASQAVPAARESSNTHAAAAAAAAASVALTTAERQHQHQHPGQGAGRAGAPPSTAALTSASHLSSAAPAAIIAVASSPPSASALVPLPPAAGSPGSGGVGVSGGSAGGPPSISVALDRFRGGVGQFQQVLDGVTHSLERERQEVQEQRDRLDQDRRAFDEECRRVQHELHGSEQVLLNVGGHKFTTSAGTLRNAPAPSLFNAMFSGRHVLKTDESGCYFLDRDGRHFHEILNFLRDGVLNYPSDGTDFKYLLELRAEAEYYGLVGLLQQIDRFPYGLVRVQRAATLNLDDSWMYEDGQDEVVFTVGSACHLLGVGLCGTEGGITVELEVYEVEPADFSSEVCTLQTAAQSFTKSDGQVVRMLLPAPALLQAGKVYMLSALIKGSESYCCEDGMQTCIAGGVKVTFQNWESPNGTNELRGQFPEIYVRPI